LPGEPQWLPIEVVIQYNQLDDAISWADEMIGSVQHRTTEEDFARNLRSFVVAVG